MDRFFRHFMFSIFRFMNGWAFSFHDARTFQMITCSNLWEHWMYGEKIRFVSTPLMCIFNKKKYKTRPYINKTRKSIQGNIKTGIKENIYFFFHFKNYNSKVNSCINWFLSSFCVGWNNKKKIHALNYN